MPIRRLVVTVAVLAACHEGGEVPLDSGSAQVDPCGRPVYRPQSGFTSDDPVLADPDEAVFGTTHPDPYQVHLSWADDPATTMAIVWRTDLETMATQVQWGLDTTYGESGVGRSFVLTGGEDFGRLHEANLCGLTPGTTYHYRVGGEGHWSADRTFTTPPAPGPEGRIRFLMAGDSRDHQEIWGQILIAAAAHAPDFYVFTGDAVDLGTNLTEWDHWYSAGEGFYDQHPVLNAHGNHEFQIEAYYGLVALPDNEQWFSLDVGPAHLVFLNDTVAVTGDRELQAGWMAKDLAATTQPWKFAFHHIPAYSSCENHGSNTELQKLWSPVEEAGGVAIDFAGHNHNYERSVPLRGGVEVGVDEGTTYIVSAGAGADLYDNKSKHAFTATATVTNNYTIVDVDGTSVRVTAYDLAGNVIDTFERSR